MAGFLGIDHIDVRVRSLRDAERFYDGFFSALGLTRKRYAYVDGRGNWVELPSGTSYNVAEYVEEPGAAPAQFVGIIEDAAMTPTQTRIAFRVADPEDLDAWHARLLEFGADHVEWSEDRTEYPALFFDDPCGTKLELCARRPG